MKMPYHNWVKPPHARSLPSRAHSVFSSCADAHRTGAMVEVPMTLPTAIILVSETSQKQEGATHRVMPYFAVSSGFFGSQWHEIHPQYWTKYQVWEWLQHLLDTNQLDASCIPFQEFDISGEHLCSMSLQEFTRAAGSAGQLLYSNLQHLKWNGESCLGRAGVSQQVGLLLRSDNSK